jgi:succinate-semialdehyde dehydrogenase/glutarate-semialdehyde dehydrogenase
MAASQLADEVVASDAARSYVRFEPLGVVLAVMPWNFPFWQVFRCAVPALMAGNAVILKHASNVPGCALAIESLVHEAGFEPALFRALLVGADAVEAIIEAPAIKAVSLTGSTPAGRSVAATAGRALKKTVLELGGNDPYLVLDDADIDVAAQACVTGRLLNSGQSCIAAKRWIVVESVSAQFEQAVIAMMCEQVLGDPLDSATQIGPLARVDLRDQLHQQVSASVAQGARILLGGEIPACAGAWYLPSILTDVRAGMPAYSEELFGPVAVMITVADGEHGIAVANDTRFGLGAAVFTRNVARGEAIAATRLRAGSCFVNTFVRSDPRLPFGGTLDSGYGRELGALGIREFVNAKTVFVA